MTELILASASPRRRDLLSLLGLPFQVIAPPEEDLALTFSQNFPALSQAMARAKARVVAQGRASGIIIAADTLVAHRGRALGKPANPQAARRVLQELRGEEHQVITGLAVVNVASAQVVTSYTLTRVWMRHYSYEDVLRYVDSGDSMDKAGAYAIQNPQFRPVERIEGCYFNVVGLPLLALAQALAQVGFEVGEKDRAAIPAECLGCPTATTFKAQETSPGLR